MSRNPKLQLVPVLDDERIGHEARAVADDHIDLKIWLRLLACSTQIEQQIRQRLRARFGTTLARFDYLAQLERHPGGLRMNALSRYLMVTGGNITGLTDQLTKEGLVARVDDPEDRRAWRVAMTARGRAEFAAMAAEHESWLAAMFRGLAADDKDRLYGQLGRLRVQLARHEEAREAGAEDSAAPGASARAAAARSSAPEPAADAAPKRSRSAAATPRAGRAAGAAPSSPAPLRRKAAP